MKKFNFIILAFVTMLFISSNALATPETLTSVRAAKGFPVAGVGHGGSLKTAHGSYNVTANVEDGDIFEMCRIPAGATVVGGRLYAFDIDLGTTAETLDMDVGWAANGSDSADADGLLNGGVLTGDAVTGVKPEVGTSMPFGGVLIVSSKKSFARETVIQVEVNAAAETFTAGTIGVIVDYLMEE